MSAVALVNSTPVYGLNEGYRRSQLGNPTSSVGQAPKFRGEVNLPGSDVRAPKVLASAARQNRSTNVTIPYPRVCSSEDLVNKGRLSPGDVAFISKYPCGFSGSSRLNDNQKRQIITSVSTPHANISRLVGLDYMNRGLGPDNYKVGATVLKNSPNPLDEWRSLSFLNEYTLDGVVLSNDSPGYVESTSAGVRNDQIFNIGVQGPVQLNNGFEDSMGRGVAIHYEKAGQTTAESLIGGPFYSQYPIQMFDRQIRPLSDLFVGLICKKIEGKDLETVLANKPSYREEFGDDVKFIHVFEYRCFSSRQVDQFATEGGEDGNALDADIVDNGRGLKRVREDDFLPRKLENDDEQFLGIKRIEVKHMVGAWRIGKVLDVASQRQRGYHSGPVDTSFSVTLNLSINFLDWRQLRRNFTMNLFGHVLDLDGEHWTQYKLTDDGKYTFKQDDGRVLQWPTTYTTGGDVDSVPVDPAMTYLANKLAEQRKTYMEKVKTATRSIISSTSTIDAAPPPATVPIASATSSVFIESSPTKSSLGEFPKNATREAASTTQISTATPSSNTDSKAPIPADQPQEIAQPTKVAPKATSRSKTPPKAASKSTAKKPVTTGAIGDEVLANIFGSTMPGADASVAVDDAASDSGTDASQGISENPRSFPRRRDR